MFIFDFPPNDLTGMEVMLSRTGSQVGGYFGGTVLGLDVTGDGRPELLVGAPLHSQQPVPDAAPTGLEEGRVCVYRNLGGGQLSEEPSYLYGDRVIRGRFGSAVANVGDLDMDGYNGELPCEKFCGCLTLRLLQFVITGCESYMYLIVLRPEQQ